LTLFDAPLMDGNWPKRNDSAIPSQALALMNHPQVLECATALAERVCREAMDDRSRLDRMFRLTLGRMPAEEERAVFAAQVAAFRAEGKEKQTWEVIAHALLSCNEFLYVD
jgi:hypothetical protein